MRSTDPEMKRLGASLAFSQGHKWCFDNFYGWSSSQNISAFARGAVSIMCYRRGRYIVLIFSTGRIAFTRKEMICWKINKQI